jgi:hypothetical protein
LFTTGIPNLSLYKHWIKLDQRQNFLPFFESNEKQLAVARFVKFFTLPKKVVECIFPLKTHFLSFFTGQQEGFL